MNYRDAIEFLYSQLPVFQRTGAAAYKEGLDNIIALDQYFGSPHRNYKTIHIAGTNGKGSVSHILASILNKAGYKTGLYTSPHLIDFRERIKIDGEMISPQEVCNFVDNHRKIIDNIKPSFFEMTVAMAFDYFARMKTEIAVIEVGLGGRLDSTNIITPEVSVITNIGYDHMQFLGNSLPQIAFEKAGIIKHNIPVVVGETHPETSDVFLGVSSTMQSALYFADQEWWHTDKSVRKPHGRQIFNISARSGLAYHDLVLDLAGIYQEKNILTVLMAIEILRDKGLHISEKDVYNGCLNASSSTGLAGRWQIVSNYPKIICDTGHNKEGIEMVVKQISETEHNRLHWVFGMVNDKDPDKILSILPQNAGYYFTKAAIPRALNENKLAEKAKYFGLNGHTFPDVCSAFTAAKKNASANDLIMIGGSTFVVADFLQMLNQNNNKNGM